MRLNAKQILFCTGGRFLIEPIDAAEIISGITWDSREVKPGDLFVALAGEKVDGHDFIEDAIYKGARSILVNEPPAKKVCILAKELGVSIIEVPNTFHAISDLAREWRRHLKGKVVAVTGSCGKTTTKNLIRDVAASKYSVTATVGNQNNELGCPKTILAADPDTQVIVVEMGMDHLGDILKLCEIAKPDWGVITNIGDSHMEILGSKDNIAVAKSELFESLPMGAGIAIANADDPYTPKILDMTKTSERSISIVYYSSSQDLGDRNDLGSVWARDIEMDGEGRPSFKLCFKGFASREMVKEATLFDMEPDVEVVECKLMLHGEHNAINACAAASVGKLLGISSLDIASALAGSVPESGRADIQKARDGFMVINDAYNASPDSMRASLKTFASMSISGKKYAVLGDMGELGSVAVDSHIGIGEFIATLPIDELICIGDLSSHTAKSAVENGMPENKVIYLQSIGEVLEALEGRLNEEDAVLVKGSHFMGLNRVVDGLIS